MDSYISALLNFTNKEYDSQVSDVLEMWDQSLAERLAHGVAVSGIQVDAVDPPYAQLRCPVNLSKFRVGDYLILHRGDPRGDLSYKCRLDQDRDTLLRVRQGYHVTFDRRLRGNGWILDRQMMDLRKYIKEALVQLDDGSSRSRRVLDILKGGVQPRYRSLNPERWKPVADQNQFNPSQREAFRKALAAENFHLIQGPPGTGKTYLLAWLADTLARQGQRVLITAFTHRAINNALRKIGRETGFGRVAKIGQQYRADDLTWKGGKIPNYEYGDQCPYHAEEGVILGGTCFSLRTNRLKGVHFDTVIFDEAGQIPLTLAAAGMLVGDRYLFIGDHKQMAPIITAEHDQVWVTRSVFETLFKHAPGTMLEVTYRMNEEINRYPSRRFYGGKVKPSQNAKDRVLNLRGKPGKYGRFLGPSPASLFIQVDHPEEGMRSEEEAQIAAGIVREAVRRGLPEAGIAVVAPYRAQVRLIRNALLEYGIEMGGQAVVVDTVERIQGQERDVIIFSLTTSDPEHAAERADFYFQPNRLNVAITRPRVKRIVIGDHRLFDAADHAPAYREWVEKFKGLWEDSEVVQWGRRKNL